MTYIKDLDPCNYFGEKIADCLTAVGWLSGDHPYSKGEVSQEFLDRLHDLTRIPWQPFTFCGVHECELCDNDPPYFHKNLFVPYEGAIYAAPIGILHYITTHQYQPPDKFIKAVLNCPDMNSPAYDKAMFKNGRGAFIIYEGELAIDKPFLW